jgi:O-antigen ligase/polysaccharide polymerase Wzy-like membrane protein
MIVNIKALIVVLAIATMVFLFGRPLALLFSNEPDFSRRRNVWFVLTVTAFLSPNFWLFALVAIPVLVWAGRKDTNPIALYLILLHVIPPIPIEIPVVGIKQLFALDNYRLLSFCVLIPAVFRLRRLKNSTRIRGLTAMDLSILAFGLLQLVNYVPPDLPNHTILEDSATNVLRRGFLFLVDVYVLYFVVSRSCNNRRAIIDTLGAFCLASAIMASVAVFESFKSWLLYTNIGQRWGIPAAYGSQYGVYFFREGFLRAQASAGHSLSLGYTLAIAFGFWLYLKSHVKSARWQIAVAILFWLGLLASQARGPMLSAVAIYFAFSLLGPRAVPRVVKAAAVVALLIGATSLTPFGQRIIDSIPYFGQSTDRASVDYRQRLAERSWELIQLHPFLGDPLAMTQMEDLRQGEGIIDLVNTYASVALFYGSIGLALFLAVIILGLVKSFSASREIARRDQDSARLGDCLVACLFGTLLIIATTSFVSDSEKLFYLVAGLAAAYAYMGKVPERG